jgi:colanic acid/amylovoran biosynthesis glycosyltransferase
VREKIAQAHLFLLPSVTGSDGDQEGIPVSLMEAQACGLPVVSTRHSGIPELVHDGKSGLLADERDVPGIANAIIWLIEHSEEWINMGKEGRKIVEANFNIHTLNQELVSLYEQVSKNHQSRQAALQE